MSKLTTFEINHIALLDNDHTNYKTDLKDICGITF